MGQLRNSDGSAEWNTGETPYVLKNICSVNGPLEAKARDELPQQATLELVYRRNIGLPMIRERLIQDKLHACLLAQLRRDLLPRSLVQVVVQLLEGGGILELELSEGINVMTKALLDAGIPMSGLIPAISYGIDEQGQIVQLSMGISADRQRSLQSWHVVAYKYAGEEPPKLVLCESTGQFTKEQLLNLLELAVKDTKGALQKITSGLSG